MRLSGPQFEQLTEALVDAFTLPGLRMMLRFRLDKNLDAIAGGDNLTEVGFNLIRTAEAEGWTDTLVLATRESNPGNVKLFAVAQQVGLAPATPAGPELERIIKQANSFLDVARWRQRLGEIEGQVCRVEVRTAKGVIYGTGFLLGPDLVMTNYHVVDSVIEAQDGRADQVVLRFDYKRLTDGTILNPGTTYRLTVQDWLVDASPLGPVDHDPSAQIELPRPDELDYALLRVDGAPGHDPVGTAAEPGAPARRWIDVPSNGYELKAGTALFIVQHPQGEPLKLAIDTDAVIGINANGTRVRYKTNTEPGSSGSPCFNADWDLVALHHSGDPNFAPTYNQGIPFPAILKLMEERGHRDQLSRS